MEFKKFNFDPPDGFRDSGYYEDTPVNAREVLQRQHDQVKDYINGMADILNSKKEGESGSEYIASPKIDGVEGENVFSQIKSIKRQLLDASAGSINDGSVTSVKLASQSVTDEKIATGSIKSEHFSKDAQCPYASETKMINGVPASYYQPVTLASDLKIFKERVSDERISGIYGKTIGDYRYFTDKNGKIKKLSLEDGTMSEVVDFAGITTSAVVYDVDDNGDLYIGFLDFSDPRNVTVCFYKHENNETYPVIRVPISPATDAYHALDDILIIGDDLYALYTVGSSLGYHMLYLYKYSLSELEDAEESVYVFSDKMSTKKMNGKLFMANGDMYFHNYRIKDMNFESFETYEWNFLGESKGKLYVYHSNYVLVDEKMFPCMAVARDLDDEGIPYDSFIRGDYIYRKLSDYLFRSRIM